MPEIHIWCGLVQTQEIVDFSIGGLMEGAKLRPKVAAEPPPFISGAIPARYRKRQIMIRQGSHAVAMESLLKMSNEETACRDAYAI